MDFPHLTPFNVVPEKTQHGKPFHNGVSRSPSYPVIYLGLHSVIICSHYSHMVKPEYTLAN